MDTSSELGREKPDPTHPWWDSAAHCTAGQLPDLSTGLRAAVTMDHHKSLPVRVERGRLDDVTAVVYATSSATEPIGETVVTAEVELVRSDYLSIEAYSFTLDQLRTLIAALAAVLPILSELAPVRRREDVAADGCSWWCSGGHAPDYPTCNREVADFTLVAGTTAVVEVHRWENDEPTVVIYEHTAGDTTITTISARAAVEFGLALLGAAGLAGAR